VVLPPFLPQEVGFMSSLHLRCLNGYYYFRTRIPNDLLRYFDSPEIQKSLRTRKRSTAKTQSKMLASQMELLFAQIRSGLLEDDQINQLIDNYFPPRKGNADTTVKAKFLSQAITLIH
jgi:hypothetical protein